MTTSPLDKPAFTATAAELQSVAKGVARGAADMVLLREENDVSYDERGRSTSRWRLVFVVTSQAGAIEWSNLASSWHPSYQDKPALRARVIDAQGRVLDLDPSLITEEAYVSPTDALECRRRIAAPLPPLSIGAVVEQEVTIVDREPLLGGAAASTFLIDTRPGIDPRLSSRRARFSVPLSRKLTFVAHGLPSAAPPSIETKDGREITTFTFGAVPPGSGYEPFLPGDVRSDVYIRASPVASWSTVARDYRALVDKVIAEGPVALPSELPRTASQDTVVAIVQWLHQQVRTTQVAFHEAPITPSPPAQVMKRGAASSLDVATLLVALLRQAGVRADLALVRVGPAPDIDRDVPAINVFDHVIVRARIGTSDLWIDPREQLVYVDWLPAYVQARHVLVVAADTSALITTPISPPANNVVRAVRTYELEQTGNAKVTEVRRESGVFAQMRRRWIRDNPPETVRGEIVAYVNYEYQGTLIDYTITNATDLTKPIEVRTVVREPPHGHSGRRRIEVDLLPSATLRMLPFFLVHAGADPEPRRRDAWLPEPHIYEIENRLVVPIGFTVPSPAPDRTRALGPFELSERQRVEGRTLIVTFRLDATKQRLTPAEVARVQHAARALRDEEAVVIVFQRST